VPLTIKTLNQVFLKPVRPTSRSKRRAWERSMPLSYSSAYRCRGAVKNIQAYDPDVILRFDPKFDDITIWRRPSIGRWHPLLQLRSPWGSRIDGRLYQSLLYGDKSHDRAKYGVRNSDEYWDHFFDAQEKAEQDRRVAIISKQDRGLVLHAMKRKTREMDGNPRGLFSQVHGRTPITRPGNLGLLPNGTLTSLPGASRIPRPGG